jgi:hypothetical protein
MPEPFPRPMTATDRDLEAQLAAAGEFDAARRFVALTIFSIADEFELRADTIEPLVLAAFEGHLAGEDPLTTGGRLSALTGFAAALDVQLEALTGRADLDAHKVGTWGTPLWRVLRFAAPFLYSARRGDGEPEEERRLDLALEGWVA